ncbi:type I methionyl aminopeptidase [Candidatus Saccharibacteria bacterium]|nr:type I methionyl aminopeptidase [Candidatus Saccharibacteria bacterium]
MRPKSTSEIAVMRQAGRMLAAVLDRVKKAVAPGISTKELSDMAAAELKQLGGQPAFLGYEGFPEVMCVSVNNEIVHGLPLGSKKIAAGDVVKLDFGVKYQGLVVDSAITVIANGKKASSDVQRLLKGTEQALYAGIDAIKGEGTHIGDVSAAVEAVLNKYKLGVIRELVGHGLGDSIHEAPNIPNYGVKGAGPALKAGMTIAIEPMASLGDWPVQILKNGTVIMKDGSLGAHFEHTVLVTDKGAEILTQA